MNVLAACHVHSEWSYDGSWRLEALAESFRRRGYRILLMTEHDRGFSKERLKEYRSACSKASSERLLIVPGIEYSDEENRVHVLVWGDIPFLGEGLRTTEMLAEVCASGGVAVLAHPSRREAWKSFEPEWSDKLLGIEIWNRKYDGWAPGKTAPHLLENTKAVCFVGLDFHTDRQFFPLGMSLDLHGEPSEATVLDALKEKRCVAHAFRMPLRKGTRWGAISLLKLAERGRRTVTTFLNRSGARRAKLHAR